MTAKLIYASNMSLDGFTEDADGGFNWAPPNDDVFVAITELMASMDTYLYGRRMYEVMSPWETDPELGARSDLTAAYASAWQAANKIVYSTTLSDTFTSKTRLERSFDLDAVADLKAAASGDLLVGGPHLAAQALRAGLVDECVFIVWPISIGGRNPALPPDARLDLALVEERRIGDGVLWLRYRTT